jgi:hypothetical protein
MQRLWWCWLLDAGKYVTGPALCLHCCAPSKHPTKHCRLQATLTCSALLFRRTLPMWPAIFRPGKVRPGVVPGPVEPCSRWDLLPWLMAPRFMPYFLMVPAEVENIEFTNLQFR